MSEKNVAQSALYLTFKPEDEMFSVEVSQVCEILDFTSIILDIDRVFSSDEPPPCYGPAMSRESFGRFKGICHRGSLN
jgi:hypothetical protein